MASGAPISFASIAQKDQKKPPLRVVQLEGQTLLKIAKHCKENANINTVVTGQLLGLDVGQTLEVTDCFPFPVSTLSCSTSPATHLISSPSPAAVDLSAWLSFVSVSHH